MKWAEDLAILMLGWLLGLLAKPIQDRMQRSSRRSELRAAIMAEMDELRFTIASEEYLMETWDSPPTDAQIDWYLGILRSYKGRETARCSELKTSIEAERAIPQSERKRTAPRSGSLLSRAMFEYDLEFLEARALDLTLFPTPFQTAVLAVKRELKLHNQACARIRRRFESAGETLNAAQLAEARRGSVIHQAWRVVECIERIPQP